MNEKKPGKFGAFKLSQVLFILPNAFTLASVFCGLFAIFLMTTDGGANSFYNAAVAIFFACIFDMLDGRVARLTKTQSSFGVQLDSLADQVSFGVAPAVLVYKWALLPMGIWGMISAFIFCACGTIRLARFNVLTAQDDGAGPSKFFVGLPIPLSASMLVALVIAHFRLFEGLPLKQHNFVLVIVLLLAYLMVSRVQYWTFKDLKFGRKTLALIFFLVIVSFYFGQKYPASVILCALIACYIFAGIVRYLYLFRANWK